MCFSRGFQSISSRALRRPQDSVCLLAPEQPSSLRRSLGYTSGCRPLCVCPELTVNTLNPHGDSVQEVPGCSRNTEEQSRAARLINFPVLCGVWVMYTSIFSGRKTTRTLIPLLHLRFGQALVGSPCPCSSWHRYAARYHVKAPTPGMLRPERGLPVNPHPLLTSSHHAVSWKTSQGSRTLT